MTFAEQPIGQFAADVASTRVTPSGGAVAAVSGAMGASLCEMVCIHTANSNAAGSTLSDLGEEFGRHRRRLLRLADDDAAAVDSLQAAFREHESTSNTVQTAVKRATDVPLEIATVCLAVIEAGVDVVENGNPNAVADAVTGIALAHAAHRSAVFTVRTNLELLTDPEVVSNRDRQATELAQAAQAAMDRVDERVDHSL
ncbi:cyclodeaminase/cyclohydrolase family protein [Halohasta litorea]|uniref:Cyclodeaminase/cyclohydrolase family protein n=1 Tax=Halohasta litorea TaxID=869891 RepID=A0ABD6D4Q8_9EURY|nr:cyclodeaminase/cyclohydrolase family protein [Halohasta litorea]MEA1931542.1 cyclodeaminase/cyclohydrolase family protein [Euryarchaeota archaeon]